MRTMRLVAAAVVALAMAQASRSAHAAQNVSYVYDALGRLTEVQILGGPVNGVTEAYQYDAAGNRLNYNVAASGQSCPPQ